MRYSLTHLDAPAPAARKPIAPRAHRRHPSSDDSDRGSGGSPREPASSSEEPPAVAERADDLVAGPGAQLRRGSSMVVDDASFSPAAAGGE